MRRSVINIEKLRVALRRMSRDHLLIVAERAIEIAPRAELRQLVGDMVRLDELAEGKRGAAPLLDEVRKFHEASLRGEYYDSFDVNSKNFMDKLPKSTLANKAKLIRDVLRIGQLEPEVCRRELLASDPMAWMISVNGFIVDARTMPAEIQAEARRRGLIPDLPAERLNAGSRGGEPHEEREVPTAGGVTEPKGDAHAKGLAEGMRDVVDILRRQPASGSDGPDGWDRIVRLIAKHDNLPDSEVKVIEKAIAETYRGWSDAQRRSIWYETDSGTIDDDDDDTLCDTSFNGIGYALQVEMLDEVTHAAWRDADELKKAAAKWPRGKKGRSE